MSNDADPKPGPLRRLHRWLRSVLFYEHWMIGIVDQPIGNALNWIAAPPIRWIAPFDKKRYLADPFPWPGSADTLLCETFDMATGTGKLSALKLDSAGAMLDEIPVALPFDGHLSFPFLFMHDGQLFLMPESASARSLEIFRWREQDGQWISHAVVFGDRPVADAVLFEKDGLFWIAYTDIAHDPHDNLHLVYAVSLAGPWRAHAANPVQRGRDRCRGAGAVFSVGRKLYRPAQDCSQIYGGAIRLMEIILCTPTAYEERQVAYIAPSARDYPHGFHTLSAWGDKCLVDGMRITFSGKLLWQKIRRRLGLKN